MTPGLRWAVVVGVEALLILLLLPFGFVFTGSTDVHQFQMLVLALGGAAGWILVLWRPAALAPALVLAPLVLLATLVLAAFISPYPSLSWPATWHPAAYTGIFWLLAVQASDRVGRKNLLTVVAIVVVLAIASYLLAVLIEWWEWLGLGFPLTSLPLRPSNVGGLASIPTWLADLVALGSPVLVANLWSRGARIAAGVLTLMALAAIVLTGTRSVLLVLAAVSVVAVLFVVRGRAGRRLVTAVIIGVLAIGIIGTVVALGSTRSFDEGRSSAYASAIFRLMESPLLGTGPGTYGVERMRDPVDVIGHLAFPDAHNILLTTLAESGIIGLLGLLSTVAMFGVAVRQSWARSPGDRLVIAGALFGVAVFAGHGMVDVVFGLIGIILVAIAVVALAATDFQSRLPVHRTRAGFLRAGLGIGMLVIVPTSGAVVRTEMTFGTVAEADAALLSAPADALAIARRATNAAPDLVPGWWVQMVAADAAGDPQAAFTAARELIELEGFGQQWMSLAILASRQSDRTVELQAVARATAGPPVDPLVELNVIELLGSAGDRPGAEAAARRLLDVQPDMERIVRTGPPEMAEVVAAVRADVAAERLADGDASGAFLVALSGEDRPLADRLLGQLATVDPALAEDWPSVVDAWFGDQAARAGVDAAMRARRTSDRSWWAWRLAGRVCDETAMSFWERTIQIAYSFHPTTPNELFLAPTNQARDLPILYPTFVWKLDHPQLPYVAGTWTFTAGRPICAKPGS